MASSSKRLGHAVVKTCLCFALTPLYSEPSNVLAHSSVQGILAGRWISRIFYLLQSAPPTISSLQAVSDSSLGSQIPAPRVLQEMSGLKEVEEH